MTKTPRFTDAPHLPATVKTQVYRDWVAFLKSGLRRDKFTQALYDHLTLYCSFIAHYNRNGFYEYYFARPSEGSTMLFLDQFNRNANYQSVEYGGTHWVSGPDGIYADINNAMIDVATTMSPLLRRRIQHDLVADLKRQRSELDAQIQVLEAQLGEST